MDNAVKQTETIANGDEVKFRTKQGKEVTGVVNKVNKVTVMVTANDGHNSIWKVHPVHLQKVQAVAA